MPTDCIFCKIGAGEVQGDILDRDDQVFVLRDINPQAPVHLLVLPFEHIPSISGVTEKNMDLIARMTLMAKKAAAKAGAADKGYRLAINCGREGGQTVAHLHMHVLGGRQLSGRLG